MNKSKSGRFIEIKSDNIVLASLILFYLIIGILLLPKYQYIICPDGISYISIAQNYISGRFEHAINGYWGPMYSWLLVPFLMFWPGKVQALISTKILALIIGSFTIIGAYLLAEKLNFDIKLKVVTVATLIPWILFFSFDRTTPDLLVLTILIFYLNFLFDPNYIISSRQGLLTGFAGALAFLSKGYAFFFVLSHFTISNIFYFVKFQKQRKRIIKNFVLGLMIFLVISGIWITLISEKYNMFTTGTSGTYNFALMGPESQSHPVYYELIEPTNTYAVSAWEDPSYLKFKSWSPLSSIDNFNYLVMVIVSHIISLVKIIELFSFLSIIIILLASYLSLKSSNDDSKNKLILILLTILIYSAGYCLIIVEIRYIWILVILMLLLGIFCLNILLEEFSMKNNYYLALISLLCFSFIISPIIGLQDNYNKDKDFYDLSLILEENGFQGSNIATGSVNYSTKSAAWGATFHLAYYLDSKFYGVSTASSGEQLTEELKSNKIEYYILWQNESTDIGGYKELKNLGFDNPKIYQLFEG